MEGPYEWVLRIITKQHNAITIQLRRAAITPPNALPAVVDDAQVFGPEQLAVEIKAIQSFRAEESYQPLPISYESGIGMSGLLVSFGRGLAGANDPFPTFLSG